MCQGKGVPLLSRAPETQIFPHLRGNESTNLIVWKQNAPTEVEAFCSSMVSVIRFYGFTSELACAPLAAAATQDNRGPASKGEFSIAFRLPLCGSSCCPETVALI